MSVTVRGLRHLIANICWLSELTSLMPFAWHHAASICRITFTTSVTLITIASFGRSTAQRIPLRTGTAINKTTPQTTQ